MNVTSKLCRLKPALQNFRNLYITNFVKSASAYEGPGKTTISFISKEIGSRLLINHCDENGFSLNIGSKIIGPAIIFPRYVLCWNVESGEHINSATLSLFSILEPKPDLLIIGLDDKYDFPCIRNIEDITRKLNIKTEIVSAHHACTIFNFANEEGRYVVAALIPKKFKSRLMLNNTEPKVMLNEEKINNKSQ